MTACHRKRLAAADKALADAKALLAIFARNRKAQAERERDRRKGK